MIFQTSMIMFHVNLQGCTQKWFQIEDAWNTMEHPPQAMSQAKTEGKGVNDVFGWWEKVWWMHTTAQ